MDNGKWQQISEAAACTAITKVHSNGGAQRFTSSANKAGTPYEYEVRRETNGRLVQRNLQTNTEREICVVKNDALPKANALQLLRIGVPLAPGLHTAEGNPRLQLLMTASKPPPPQTKEDAIMHVVHAAIFNANAVVYGGFVRDYVVRNESANDVDVNTADYDATERQMTAALKALNIIEQDPSVQSWGKASLYRRLTYSWQGHKLEVDLVDPAKVPFSSPGVDCDVGNLAIDKARGLTLKKSATDCIVPLRTCVAHAQAKEFVFFYDLSGDSGKMARERLTKYLGRGWICRGNVPEEVRSTLSPAQLALLQADTAYSEEVLEEVRRACVAASA